MGLDIINQLKRQKGWTNVDLANASGVPKATIDKITSGATTNPNFDTVWAIAEALECTVDQFKSTKNPLSILVTTNDFSSNALSVAKAYDKAEPREQQIVRLTLKLPPEVGKE